jgi:hypothetical protein
MSSNSNVNVFIGSVFGGNESFGVEPVSTNLSSQT